MIGTKIVVTVGPSSESKEMISSLIDAGANAFRFNLKHNTKEWHAEKISFVREISRSKQKTVAIMVDIPGIQTIGEWIELATGPDIDYIALSYIKTVEDIRILLDAIKQKTSAIKVIAKIETAEAVSQVETIIHHSSGVMVARGDLGSAIPVEEIPYIQKKIITLCLETGKPVITATEMLESMIVNPYPTRAEVSDVANAMYDLTDSVMLSAESASGKHPVESVTMMRKVADFIDARRPLHAIEYRIRNQSDALTYAANDLAKQHVIEEQKIQAFVIVTETGETAKSLARLRPSIPIIAITRNQIVCNELMLVWGITPLLYPVSTEERDVHIGNIREILKASCVVSEGSRVIMVYGSEIGVSGNTNVLRIEVV